MLKRYFTRLNITLIGIAFILVALVGFDVVKTRHTGLEAVASTNNFLASESPSFIIYLDDGPTNQNISANVIITENEKASDKLKIINVQVYDPYGRPIDSIKANVQESDEGITVNIEKKSEFRPGLYGFQVTYEKDGKIIVYNQNFTWGVLALNTDKSFYLPNEKTSIDMGILDDLGDMVCDAEVSLEITNPDGTISILSTANGNIKISPECNNHLTEFPDYHTEYKLGAAGTYGLRLTAKTRNGTKTAEDKILVLDKVDFDVQRIGHTRIYPLHTYKMEFNVVANKNLSMMEPIVEYVPASFKVIPQNGLTVTQIGDIKELKWNKVMLKGKRYTFSYQYDAPDISPEFYLLGPLKIGKWQESRQWQIASDSTVFIVDTGAATYTVPSDYVDSGSVIKVIGGGGAGFNDTTRGTGAGGGGGGAFASTTPIGVSADQVVDIQVGTGGTTSAAAGQDTWFGDTTCTGGSSIACARGGSGASSITGAAGGGTDGVGTQVAGGAGGNGNNSGDTSGGGGGAGGQNGIGGTGGSGPGGNNTGGGGGGGHGGGGNGADGTAIGGAGGTNYLGGGSGAAGAPNGGVGTVGGGGGGADKGGTGAVGGAGQEFDATHGSGGGGGGTGDNPIGAGSGALYGGGGAGGGLVFGTGAQGIIVIDYTPVANTAPTIESYKDFPDPIHNQSDVTFSVDWNDDDAEDNRIFICDADAAGPGGCSGGVTWCSTSLASTDPVSCSFTTRSEQIGSNNYFAFTCDDQDCVASSGSGTFTVKGTSTPTFIIKGGAIFKGGFTIK